MKTCSKCNIKKPLNQFYKDRDKKDGLRCRCKMCDKKYQSPEYNSWRAMKARCLNPNNEHYGGRGIRVCKRWLNSFDNFLKDMGSRPSAKHSIERINNNGNYTPKNCCWTTQPEQLKNRRPYGKSKYRYVCFHKQRNKWVARPILNGKRVHLGLFTTELAAHRAVQKYLKSP